LSKSLLSDSVLTHLSEHQFELEQSLFILVSLRALKLQKTKADTGLN